MMRWLLVLGLVGMLGQGPAPAKAPAGTTGICRDGSYTSEAAKDGACKGHKGVQTWYTAAAPAMPAPVPGGTVKSMPAPTPVGSVGSVPSPAAGGSAAAAAAPAKKLSPAQAAAQKTAAPGGGKGLVWVNTASKVYHCSDSPYYGKTKAGSYMSEADAQKAGAHAAKGESCAGK